MGKCTDIYIEEIKMPIRMTLKVPFKVKKDDRWYISSCSMLDIHSQGQTERKAIENLNEALALFLFSCYERGTLVEVLKESGFTLQEKATRTQKKTTHTAKKIDRSRLLDVNIPFKLSPALCHA